MYDWLGTFAETEPELFGGAENIVDRTKRRWVESTRTKIAQSKALAIRPKAPGVVIVDTLLSEPALTVSPNPTRTDTASAISVELRGATVSIPPGSTPVDISSVLNAVAAL